MKSHLVFDTTDIDTILDSDNVGAFVRSDDGSLITNHVVGDATATVLYEGVNYTADNAGSAGNSIALVFNGTDDIATVVGAWNTANPSNTVSHDGVGTDVPAAGTAQLAGGTDHKALDVYFMNESLEVTGDVGITGDVNVTATDLDIRDLSFASDSVDVSGSSVSISGDVNVTQGTDPWIVSAVDLDIRDLAFATDSVDVSGSSVSISGDVNVTQGTDPWVVSATDLDIRDLSAVTDSVQSNLFDGSGNAISSTAGSLDVNITNEIDIEDVGLANIAVASGAVSSSGNIVASPLSARKYLFIANNGNKAAYIGPNGVSSSDGFPLYPGSMLPMRAGAAIDIEFVQSGGTIDMRSLELS